MLILAHRRLLSQDRERGELPAPTDHGYRGDSRYYDIEGDYFVLKYADMNTINIQYFALPSEQEE